MKITTSAKTLSAALSKLKAATNTRSNLPILSNVLLVAKGTALKITATNIDLQLSMTIEAAVSQSGSITLPCAKLSQIVSQMQCDVEMSLVTTQVPKAKPADADQEIHTVFLRSGKQVSKIRGLAASEFPELPTIAAVAKFDIAAETLSGWLGKVFPFQFFEEGRNDLAGTYFESTLDGLRIVTCDGRRLTYIDTGIQCAGLTSLVPHAAVKVLQSMLESGDITISFGVGSIHASGLNWDFSAQLLADQYPGYRVAMPSMNAIEGCWHLNREKSIAAVNYAMTQANAGMVIKLSSAPDGITIQSLANGAQDEESADTMEPAGKDMAHAFVCNGKYLLDLLRIADGDVMKLEIIDAATPHILRQGNLTSILTPIRIYKSK